MDEQDRHIISFDRSEEEIEKGKTVEIDTPTPAPAAEPEVSTVIEPDAEHRPQTHAKPAAPSHAAKKEKKYVTKGALIACMIATMIISSLLGAVIAGSMAGSPSAGNSAERNDSELSQLDLSDATDSEMTVGEIIKMNEDAVVEIVVSGTAQNMWGQLQLTQGAGSGVIVKKDGYMATNFHVIQGATKVEVTLHNGDTYSAKIIGSDAENDIAVIKIDAKDLATAKIMSKVH